MEYYKNEGYYERYFINGWTYGKHYFFDIGGFTEDQVKRMMDGETISKNGNAFWIERIAM